MLAATPLWGVFNIAPKLDLVPLQLVVLMKQLQEVAVPAHHLSSSVKGADMPYSCFPRTAAHAQ